MPMRVRARLLMRAQALMLWGLLAAQLRLCKRCATSYTRRASRAPFFARRRRCKSKLLAARLLHGAACSSQTSPNATRSLSSACRR